MGIGWWWRREHLCVIGSAREPLQCRSPENPGRVTSRNLTTSGQCLHLVTRPKRCSTLQTWPGLDPYDSIFIWLFLATIVYLPLPSYPRQAQMYPVQDLFSATDINALKVTVNALGKSLGQVTELFCVLSAGSSTNICFLLYFLIFRELLSPSMSWTLPELFIAYKFMIKNLAYRFLGLWLAEIDSFLLAEYVPRLWPMAWILPSYFSLNSFSTVPYSLSTSSSIITSCALFFTSQVYAFCPSV